MCSALAFNVFLYANEMNHFSMVECQREATWWFFLSNTINYLVAFRKHSLLKSFCQGEPYFNFSGRKFKKIHLQNRIINKRVEQNRLINKLAAFFCCIFLSEKT